MPERSKRNFYANSLVPEIITLLVKRQSARVIASQLDCSKSYVHNVAKLYVNGAQKFTVAPLTERQYIKLANTAKAFGVTAAELARAYIIDGLEAEEGT